MINKIKSLSTLLYAMLFGSIIAAITGSPALGLVFATLKFWASKRMIVPFGAFGEGLPETKTAEDIKAEIKLKQEELKAKLEAKAEKSEVEALRGEIEKLKDEKRAAEVAALDAKFAEQTEILVKQGEEITKLKDSGAGSGKKLENMADLIVKAYKDNIDKIKAIKEAGGVLGLEVKAAGTMTIVGNYSGGTVGLSSLEQGITRVQRRAPFIRQVVNSGNTTSKYVVWIEQSAPDGGAGMTAEGAAKTQADFDLVEASMACKKVTSWIKVSKEMIADVPFVEAEIRGELMELVQLKLDEQILSGDGTGDNLKGITAYAAAYSAGNFAGTIDEANNFDVLRTAISQVNSANFQANYILMNPEDVAVMELTKDTAGVYIRPLFMPDNMMTVSGVPIIANNGVTAGDFIVGDFTKSNLRVREEINIQVGYVNDDFTKNLITILAEARAVHFIKTNHVNAFSHGDFATAIAALETP